MSSMNLYTIILFLFVLSSNFFTFGVCYLNITWVNVPEEQNAILGSNHKIICVITSNPPPIKYWLRNGTRITSESDSRYVIEYDGLSIRNIQESDNGIYTCTALVLSTGTVEERAIRVEVLVAPEIEPISPVSIVEGDQARVACKARSKPPSNYTWIREDSSEDLAIKYRFSVDAKTGVLSVSKFEREDDSLYKCVAVNLVGRAEQFVNITILVKPRIYEFYNISASITTKISFICKVSGRPAPDVVFRKVGRIDSFRIGVQPDDSRILLENKFFGKKNETIGILTIANLSRSDDGLYECIGRNQMDTAYRNGHITVEYPPTFEKMKDYTSVWTWGDKPANLTCAVESIPNSTIKWKLGYQELHNNIKSNIRIEGRGPQSYLIVNPNYDPTFFARYECIAINRLGAANRYIELREGKVPNPIQQARTEATTPTMIKFNIVGPTDLSDLPLRSILVRYKLDHMTWNMAWNKTWTFNAPYVIEGLTPQHSYDFQFAAANDVGMGGFGGGNIQVTMPRRSVPTEPQILVLLGQSGVRDILVNSPYVDHYELRWNVPHDNGDLIDNYVIRYCIGEFKNGFWSNSSTDCSSEIIVSFQYQSYELNNLIPDTIYNIELMAHNSMGLSPPAQIRIKTARGNKQEYIYQPIHGSNTGSLQQFNVNTLIYAVMTYYWLLWRPIVNFNMR